MKGKGLPRDASARAHRKLSYGFQRVPMVSLHGRSICNCGCRGAHTVQRLWEIFATHAQAAALGTWPTKDFHGRPWPADTIREMLAGKPLFKDKAGAMCHVAVVEVSCDMDELPKSFGLPDYRTTHGCLRCFKHRAEFVNFATKGKKRTQGWFERTAATCLIAHRVPRDASEWLQDQICACTKRKHKAGGVVFTNKPGNHILPNVERGDRLEPSLKGYPDILNGQRTSDFAEANRFVHTYKKPKGGLNFICQLFPNPALRWPGVPGLTIDHVLLDSMHFLELGLLGYYQGKIIIEMDKETFFGADEDEKNYTVTSMMKDFYRRHNIPDTERLPAFSFKCVINNNFVKLKAGKAKTSFPFFCRTVVE